MNIPSGKLIVFYDGACPVCVKDRRWYEKLAGRTGDDVEWLDITGQDEALRQQGVDPDKALRELHVKDDHGEIHRELDAYILLMSRVMVLKPLAWLISLPLIRPLLARMYHTWVERRLAGRT
jgi:predicted DCC family thiol-disulfide oxidoreductase YuxK